MNIQVQKLFGEKVPWENKYDLIFPLRLTQLWILFIILLSYLLLQQWTEVKMWRGAITEIHRFMGTDCMTYT